MIDEPLPPRFRDENGRLPRRLVDGDGNAWFATSHESLKWKREQAELPEVTIMCADGGRHREKRLGNGNASGFWPSRASKSWSDDPGVCRDVAGVYGPGDQRTTTLDPCPVCGKHITIARENWQKVYAFCIATGRTKLDIAWLPF